MLLVYHTILLCSASLGFVAAKVWYVKNKRISFCICIACLLSLLQHSTETIEDDFIVKTSMETQFYLIVVDRIIVCLLCSSLFIYFKYSIPFFHICILSVYLLVLSDFSKLRSDIMYAIVHGCWHVSMWLYIIRISKLNNLEKDTTLMLVECGE